jgi:hypothetical protein
MDFTGLTSFIIRHTVDESTGVLTIIFRDDLDTADLGQIVLEGVRARAFFEAMTRIQEARWPNGIARQGHKTLFDKNADEGTTEFV